jgi:hypothetical protein
MTESECFARNNSTSANAWAMLVDARCPPCGHASTARREWAARRLWVKLDGNMAWEEHPGCHGCFNVDNVERTTLRICTTDPRVAPNGAMGAYVVYLGEFRVFTRPNFPKDRADLCIAGYAKYVKDAS